MPLVGFDRFNNAARAALEKSVETMRTVRGGGWGRLPQGQSATEKSLERRMSTTRAVRGGEWGRLPEGQSATERSFALRGARKREVASGNYFKGNVGEKRMETQKKMIQGWMERDQALKSRNA